MFHRWLTPGICLASLLILPPQEASADVISYSFDFYSLWTHTPAELLIAFNLPAGDQQTGFTATWADIQSVSVTLFDATRTTPLSSSQYFMSDYSNSFQSTSGSKLDQGFMVITDPAVAGHPLTHNYYVYFYPSAGQSTVDEQTSKNAFFVTHGDFLFAVPEPSPWVLTLAGGTAATCLTYLRRRAHSNRSVGWPSRVAE
jgi:hypothetical protein